MRVPIQLRLQELNPVARGWHEFSIQSLIPSSNRLEIPVIRAILIHCIMRGEDVRAEDIIADKIPQPEFEHHQEFNEPPVQPPPYHVPTYTNQHQKDLDSIEPQLQNMMWYQQQALENMSKNQAEYMAECYTVWAYNSLRIGLGTHQAESATRFGRIN
ncbi:hypothetical protein PIB30_080204 [Stylosanthes scabra]|uniref:Uncharacterized protein n=1 Tax=Stylosanthes scabra TaxID=79078 RepID=A0ABU6TTJ6_9FABA|nr:hypothetical protein [Stylosanthes scabra]